MITRLDKRNDQFTLVLDRSLLEQLQIDETTELEISTSGRALVVSPVADESRRANFEKALQSTNERFGNALRRLAE